MRGHPPVVAAEHTDAVVVAAGRITRLTARSALPTSLKIMTPTRITWRMSNHILTLGVGHATGGGSVGETAEGVTKTPYKK